MKEEWKVYKETRRGVYEVSNKGRIRKNKIIIDLSKYVIHSNGYYQYVGGFVHRIVAKAFIPNPDNKPQVDHIDSNPFNNIVENLRWVNSEEQFSNEESKKKRGLARERTLKVLKLKPLIKSLLEIEPDKLQLVKMIIDYNA